MGDLELMHHWSTHTHLTLPRAKEAKNVWGTEVPKMALGHPFLMNQLLAVSAFHLAFLHPDRRHSYSLQASHHQSHAISGMRTALAKITGDNCHALFAASSLLLFGGFASFAIQSNGLAPSVDDVLDIFLLTRGVHGVLKTSEDIISKGPFQEFFDMPKRPASNTPPGLQAVIDKLTKLGQRMAPKSLPDDVMALAEAEIRSLDACIRQATAAAEMPDMRVISTWPIFLAADFIALLRQGHPAATSVLAYFCVILRTAESTLWYTRGWGYGVATSIANSIEPSWKDVIEWPMGYIAALESKS
jgi:hypothetical protein